MILVLLNVPLAFFAVIAPVNKYSWMEADGLSEKELPYDCDGPLGVTIFLAPALLLSVSTIFLAIFSIYKKRSTFLSIVLAFAAMIFLAEIARIPAVVQQNIRNRTPLAIERRPGWPRYFAP